MVQDQRVQHLLKELDDKLSLVETKEERIALVNEYLKSIPKEKLEFVLIKYHLN